MPVHLYSMCCHYYLFWEEVGGYREAILFFASFVPLLNSIFVPGGWLYRFVRLFPTAYPPRRHAPRSCGFVVITGALAGVPVDDLLLPGAWNVTYLRFHLVSYPACFACCCSLLLLEGYVTVATCRCALPHTPLTHAHALLLPLPFAVLRPCRVCCTLTCCCITVLRCRCTVPPPDFW